MPQLLTADQWQSKPGGPKSLAMAKKLMNSRLKRHYCKNVVHPDDLIEYSQTDKKVIWEKPNKDFPKGRPRLIERKKDVGEI